MTDRVVINDHVGTVEAVERTYALAALIERRPGMAFATFAGLHMAVWTALPTLLYANLPLDLIEALTYGREWQLGYDKLPPLPKRSRLLRDERRDGDGRPLVGMGHGASNGWASCRFDCCSRRRWIAL